MDPQNFEQRIVMRVEKSPGAPDCEAGHEVGDTIRFTGCELDNYICPYALHALMPWITALMWGASIPQHERTGCLRLQCDDALDTVVFRVWLEPIPEEERKILKKAEPPAERARKQK